MKTTKRHFFLIMMMASFLLCTGQVYAYEIKVVVDGAGTVSGEGTYNSKATCTLKAKAAPNHSFMGWEKDGVIVSEYSTYEFVVTADATYTARFRATWSGILAAGTYRLTSYSGGFIINNNTGTIYGTIGNLIVNQGGNVTIQFDNQNMIFFEGEIKLNWGHLTVEKVRAQTGSTLKRHPDYTSRLLLVRNLHSNNPDDCQLTLKGYDENVSNTHLVINGGDDAYGIEGPDSNGDYTPNYNHNTNETYKTQAERPIMMVNGGKVTINKVEMTRNYNIESHGGAISVITVTSEDANNSKSRTIMTITNSNIQSCVTENAYSGAALYISCKDQVGSTYIGNSEISMENVNIFSCFALAADEGRGGVIRTTSDNMCTLSMKNCNIHDNYTNNRGCLTWSATGVDALQLENCMFYNNWSKQSGAALDIEAPVEITGGSIYNNTAKNNGGGIWIHNTGGALTVKGEVSITGNSAVGGNGGGIYYQGGTMTINGSSLTVTGNTKGTAKTEVSDNIYLPDTKTIAVGSSATASGINIGVYTQNAATASTDIPVLTSASKLTAVYNALLLGTSHLTDDRNVPQRPKYTSNDDGTIYFALKKFDYDTYNKPFVGPISNADSLYKFMCWVNGVNGFGSTHAGAAGNVTADINMSGIEYWIPIGESANYTGTFNGNGHVISGLPQSSLGYDCTNFGLFGTTEGATIQDVFLEDCNYIKSSSGNMGTLIGLMKGGTLKNSGASGTLTASNSSCIVGGLVGKVEMNSSTSATVHSSFASPSMTGYQMGGLVGDLATGCNLYNSFANAQFVEQTGNDKYMGGLVGVNNGRIENCYSRVRGTVPSARFGYLAGNNTSATNMGLYDCYAPNTPYVASGATAGTQSNLDTYNPVIAPYLYDHSNDNTLVNTSGTNLLEILNRWVEAPAHSSGGYSPWKRTTAGGYSTGAGNINGDYPIHRYKDGSGNDMYKCVASTDGIALDYAATLDAMLSRHTSNATVNLYANDNTSKGTGNNVMVYIDEEVSLLQSTANPIAAYTSQTLKTYSTANGNRWHLFSSPLQQSQIGISYAETGSVPFSWASNPCGVLFSADNDNALFPSDMPVAAFDLYSFYEPEYHWINFRRNSNSHWHENANEVPIHYNGNGTGGNGNETYLVPGKGYLVSINQEQLVQNKGILNNGDVTLQDVTKTNFNAWAGLLGFNLLGNPYQSYLDFEKFISQNISDDAQNTVTNADNLWSGDSEYTNTYATYDPKQKAYVQYKSGASDESNTASQYIHPHQGFFVRMTKGSENTNTTTVTYTNAMRTNEGQSGFRSGGSQPAYPLVNFTVRDGDGNADVAVLEIGRETDEGALKMRLGDCTGALSLGHEGKEYGILFRTEVEDYQPLRFEATESGTFTLTWNTANADFERLTLVDNIAGTETDMLVRDSYRFEATSDQYASRFKVVIGDYKGIDEPEPAEGPAESFAFQMGDQLVVNGAGTLQVIDMLGRVVKTERLTGSQNTISLPTAIAGVYLLRLTDKNGTRIQKIVVE